MGISKILKQNGSSGKIIRAQSSGKVLKQNYNFGKVFKHILPLELTGLDCTELSFLLWSKKGVFNDSRIIRIYSYDIDNNYIAHEPLSYGGGTFLPNRAYVNGVSKIGNSGWFLRPTGITEPIKQCNNGYHNVTSKQINGYAGTSLAYNTFSYTETLGNIERVYVSSYTDSTTKSAQLALFNRELSLNEFSFLYNNGNGNNLLKTTGLIGYYEFNLAESINDAICIRDLSGANHLIIQNLPAGTIEEQLDYANNNLFEAW